MKKDNRLYLYHILESIELIAEYTRNLSFEDFKNDRKTVDAVIRNLAIIGEAGNKTSKEFQNKYPAIPWKNLIGLRNILIHDYLGVDINAVWANIQKELSPLKQQVKLAINQEEKQQ